MSTNVKPLPPEALYRASDPSRFPFATTAEVEPWQQVVGQDRAVTAIKFAIGMPHVGYNMFALGPRGTGKHSLIQRFLAERAATAPVPGDWCYVNNFAEPHRPKALKLPAGKGRPLRADMARLIEDLTSAIPAAFESDEYRNRKNVIEEQVKERHEQVFAELQRKAQAHDVALIRTPVGLALAPVKEGAVLNPKEFEALAADEKRRRRAAMEELQKELEEVLQDLPRLEKEQRERVRELNHEVTLYAVSHLIEELRKRWSEEPAVLEHLEAVREDVVENANDFLNSEGDGESPLGPVMGRALKGPSPFRRYQVNLLVDNSAAAAAEPGTGTATDGPATGAPVVYEDHPTQPNLIGRIEHQSQFGTLVTDFNLIKPGALHRANGGYLILDALKVLMQPLAWETLKRTLQAGHIRIESFAESLGWASTVTLEPEPIPLQIKVVLLGEPHLYYLLGHFDPDFHELFKVAVDFDGRMARDDDNARQYAQLIATLARQENLKPLDRGAVARIVEHGARLAGDAEKLTTHMGSIVDLVREADYWAREENAPAIAAPHVQKAIEAKVYRSDRLRALIQEEIVRGTLIIDTEGAKVGQVNGLSVIQLDDYAFGRPSRITCRVRLGRGEVIDIEREVALGGPLHSKGVLILASFLSSRFSRDAPLSLSASLVFEQSYGGVEGDSASSAELYALLSALAQIPIRQSLAVTGSVDQHGNVQAIGGVNEKIEGFFDLCRTRGLDGDEGVLIPAANVKHLMLRADVVKAAGEGRFRIYPIATIDQGIEVLTGMPAGEPDADGEFPIGTVNRAVALRLRQFSRRAQALAAQAAAARPEAKKPPRKRGPA